MKTRSSMRAAVAVLAMSALAALPVAPAAAATAGFPDAPRQFTISPEGKAGKCIGVGKTVGYYQGLLKADLVLADCTSADDQRWSVVPNTPGSKEYTLRNASLFCMSEAKPMQALAWEENAGRCDVTTGIIPTYKGSKHIQYRQPGHTPGHGDNCLEIDQGKVSHDACLARASYQKFVLKVVKNK